MIELPSELDLYERASRNLGTYNNHYLDATAKTLFASYSHLNANDSYTYPEISAIKKYCGNFLLRLSGVNHLDDFQYHTTSGSAEAVFLGLLTLKRHAEETRPNAKLNVIVGSNAHICWKKAADYLDLELREMTVDEKTMVLTPADVLNQIDDNTMGVCATLGTPTTLLFDPVSALNTALADYFKKTNRFIPIHVDAAGGGFIAPFMYPHLIWDFRLPHVYTINISSHKYGMVYPCLGWLLTRDLPCLEKMTHQNDYLGNAMKRISLQFSHSAANILTQYHHIKTLGLEGYQTRIQHLFFLTGLLKKYFSTRDEIIVLNSNAQLQLPGVVFTMQSDVHLKKLISDLKNRNWYLPIYRLPAPLHQKQVARIVIRHGFTVEHIQALIADIHACLMQT